MCLAITGVEVDYDGEVMAFDAAIDIDAQRQAAGVDVHEPIAHTSRTTLENFVPDFGRA